MAVLAASRPGITLSIDENLAPDVARFFGYCGHVAFVLPKGTVDVAILTDANARGAIVVTSDRDFLR